MVEAFIGFLGAILGAGIVTFTHWIISKKDRINQLRLAALEKRLSVHQEAYTLWTELFWNLHNEKDLPNIVMKCQDWWYKNCLYLDPKSRESFKLSCHLAFDFSSIPRNNSKLRKDSFKQIRKAGEDIVKGVDLPTIGEYEGKRIDLESGNV